LDNFDNNNNNKDNNKNNKPIGDVPQEKRRSYKVKKIGWECLQIRRDLKAGMSEAEVRAKYNMSIGTFFNRMQTIRDEDEKEIMKDFTKNGGSKLVVDVKRFDERLGDAVAHMDRIITDPKASHFVQIEAQRLRLEAAQAQWKLRMEGPRVLEEFSKPVVSLTEGRVTPMQALEGLPAVKKSRELELKQRLEQAGTVLENREQWVDRVQEGKGTIRKVSERTDQ
jgi:hypothetical protein